MSNEPRFPAAPVRVVLCVVLALVAGGWIEATEPLRPIGEDAILLLDSVDTLYTDMAVSPAIRTYPEAETRLLVLRGGTLLADVGLRDERRTGNPTGTPGSTWIEEEGVVDTPTISEDGRSAVIVTASYSVRRSVADGRSDGKEERRVNGESSLTWVDASHPHGRWTMSLGQNRFVAAVRQFDGLRGVAFATLGRQDDPVDFRVLGPDLETIYHVSGLDSPPLEVRSTPADTFVGVDMAIATKLGTSDRRIVIVDLLSRTHWSYAWQYGSADEPLTWELEDTGILTIHALGSILEFDRFGRNIGSRK